MSAVARVARAYERIAEVGRPEVWIRLRPPAEALADAEEIDRRLAAGEELALAGVTVAVKDNIDVAGMPTTAGCPRFAYLPEKSAAAVTRLVDAGAVVLGKTNLDQFATGLTGTRSPYGAVRDVRRPAYVSGGSSSGSAVAVALGVADLGLATDTAGSGRVPAAFQGIVGLKPTRGLVSVGGVVAACRSFDCVSLFARDVASAEIAFSLIAHEDPADPLSRAWPPDAPLGAPPHPRVAVPSSDALAALTPAGAEAFHAACARLDESGATLVTVDIEPLLEAGRLLYGGAFVAERHASVGAFVAANLDAVDPQVGTIIAGAASLPAHQLAADQKRLDELALALRERLAGLDALLLPTAPAQPTLAAVAADPLGANAALGIYTTGTNLLDMCAVSVPAGSADDAYFGVSVLAAAFGDRVCADVARRVADASAVGDAPRVRRRGGPRALALLVVGAHLSGQPLNHQLTTRGGSLREAVRTAPNYRLHRLDTDPPKPGLVRVEDGSGASIAGEVWELPPAALGDFLAELPSPMALTRVTLADGSEVVGFACETAALRHAEDITEHGGWLAYLSAAAG